MFTACFSSCLHAASRRISTGHVWRFTAVNCVKFRSRCPQNHSKRHFGFTTKLLSSSSSEIGYDALHDVLHIHPDVASALLKERAVVALESTIITHGMPYPDNLSTAIEAETLIRKEFAVPATIAAVAGKLYIGLTQDELQVLATAEDAVKTSRRDLAWVLSQKGFGGTTVSGTMIGAHLARIPIFVTGGIGGVHRGAETSMDISADLTELGRTPITVVSAGVKSFLDIPRTLEYLETQGVTVAVYGSSQEFPAFFTRHSGVKVQINVSTPLEAAELIYNNQTLGLKSGILIAVPIPEDYAAEGERIEKAIQTAVTEASERGIRGKDITPFVLQRVNELTKGKSLEANKALLLNNVRVGTKIATKLENLKKRKAVERKIPYYPKRHHRIKNLPSGRPVVIGASVVDYSARAVSGDLVYGGQTNNGRFHIGYGGVGRNLADALSRLGADPIFITSVGDDIAGDTLLKKCSHMDIRNVLQFHDIRHEYKTASYLLVFDKAGEVELGIGDMEITEAITPYTLSQYTSELEQAPIVCIDGNVPPDSMEYIATFCNDKAIPLWFEPTCVAKAAKIFQNGAHKNLAFASPNIKELQAMYQAATGKEAKQLDDDASLDIKLQECLKMCHPLMEYVQCLIITLGKDGLVVCQLDGPFSPWDFNKDYVNKFLLRPPEHIMSYYAHHYSAYSLPETAQRLFDDVVSVSGAGDCLVAGMITALLQGYGEDRSILWGLRAAWESLASPDAVPSLLQPPLFQSANWDNISPAPTKLKTVFESREK